MRYLLSYRLIAPMLLAVVIPLAHPVGVHGDERIPQREAPLTDQCPEGCVCRMSYPEAIVVSNACLAFDGIVPVPIDEHDGCCDAKMMPGCPAIAALCKKGVAGLAFKLKPPPAAACCPAGSLSLSWSIPGLGVGGSSYPLPIAGGWTDHTPAGHITTDCDSYLPCSIVLECVDPLGQSTVLYKWTGTLECAHCDPTKR